MDIELVWFFYRRRGVYTGEAKFVNEIVKVTRSGVSVYIYSVFWNDTSIYRINKVFLSLPGYPDWKWFPRSASNKELHEMAHKKDKLPTKIWFFDLSEFSKISQSLYIRRSILATQDQLERILRKYSKDFSQEIAIFNFPRYVYFESSPPDTRSLNHPFE